MPSQDEQALICAAAMRAEGVLTTAAGALHLIVEAMGDLSIEIDRDRVRAWSAIVYWVAEHLNSEVANLGDSLRHDELVAARDAA